MKATDYFHDMNFVAGLLGYPQESCMCYGIGCKYENKSLGERAGECRKPRTAGFTASSWNCSKRVSGT